MASPAIHVAFSAASRIAPAASNRVVAPRSACLRHRVDIGAAGIHRRVHVGDLALHQLERADRRTELLAIVDIGHDEVEGRPA